MNEDRELQWDDTITNDGQDYHPAGRGLCLHGGKL